MEPSSTTRRSPSRSGRAAAVFTAAAIGAILMPVPTASAATPRVVPAASARPVALPGTLTPVPVPATIDPTGTRDVGPALTDFFRSVPNGSRVVLPAGATYRIETAVVIQDKQDLLIEGNGARSITTSRGDRTRQHWRILGGERIVIKDLTVKGANPNGGTSEEAGVRELEAQHGFNFAGTHGAELYNVTVTDVYGDFVYFGWDSGTGRWTEDVRVHHSTFLRNGRQGMSFTGARRIRIDNNVIGHTRRATFDLEPNGGRTGVEDILIEDNDVGPGRLNFIAAVGSGFVNRIAVKNNTLTGRAMNSTMGSLSERRSDWTIFGNTSDTRYGNPGGGIMAFRLTDRVLVAENSQPAQAGRSMHLVDLNATCAAAVVGNQVVDGAEVRTSVPCTNLVRENRPVRGSLWKFLRSARR